MKELSVLSQIPSLTESLTSSRPTELYIKLVKGSSAHSTFKYANHVDINTVLADIDAMKDPAEIFKTEHKKLNEIDEMLELLKDKEEVCNYCFAA